MSDRETTFERLMADFDAKAVHKYVDFTKHRYVSIERDAVNDDRYAKGHPNLRRACDHMARAVENGEAMVPEQVLDLDTGEFQKVDLFAFVAPVELDAVAVMMPRRMMQTVYAQAVGVEDTQDVDQAKNLLLKALERRSQ